jgi:hypothetical protein
VPLNRLNIVIGANNSGKSSLLAPLLLLKQTAVATDVTRPLITKGELAHIGTYADFVFGHDSARDVTLSFRYHGHNPPADVIPELDKFEDPPGELRITLSAGAHPSSLVLSAVEVLDMYGRIYLRRARGSNGRYTLEGPVRDALQHDNAKLLPRLLEQQPRGFLFDPLRISPWSEEDGKAKKPVESGRGTELYNAILGTVRLEFERTMRSLAYIGPMRDRPQRFYEHTGESPRTVGPRGEFAYEVLFREEQQLRPKLSLAMKQMGLADSVDCVELSTASDVFTVNIQRGGFSVNLADAGFGISQLLPILIQGFRKPGTDLRRVPRLILKQPEIHLNPAQQSAFAEILVKMLEHRAIMIETHSEHLLLTVRRLIASRKLKADDVSLHFVERSADDCTSRVRAVPIQQNGHISQDAWPSGFFGEGLKEAMQLAAAQAAAQRQKLGVRAKRKAK